jgi:hypothetical protein
MALHVESWITNRKYETLSFEDRKTALLKLPRCDAANILQGMDSLDRAKVAALLAADVRADLLARLPVRVRAGTLQVMAAETRAETWNALPLEVRTATLGTLDALLLEDRVLQMPDSPQRQAALAEVEGKLEGEAEREAEAAALAATRHHAVQGEMQLSLPFADYPVGSPERHELQRQFVLDLAESLDCDPGDIDLLGMECCPSRTPPEGPSPAGRDPLDARFEGQYDPLDAKFEEGWRQGAA